MNNSHSVRYSVLRLKQRQPYALGNFIFYMPTQLTSSFWGFYREQLLRIYLLQPMVSSMRKYSSVNVREQRDTIRVKTSMICSGQTNSLKHLLRSLTPKGSNLHTCYASTKLQPNNTVMHEERIHFHTVACDFPNHFIRIYD